MRATPALAVSLLLATALAGCADEPEPLVPMEPVPSTYDGVFPGSALAPLRWYVLAEHEALLAPVAELRTSVSIPEGTLQVLVNLTAEGGAARGMHVALGDCNWSRDLVLLGNGATYGADCGGLAPGGAELRIATDAGALQGRVVLAALVCQRAEGVCPAPLPVTRE